MTKDKALKLALEALEQYLPYQRNEKERIAFAAIKEALAQPEPVKHRDAYWCNDLTCKKCYSADFRFKHKNSVDKEFLTTQSQREWVGLTDDDWVWIYDDYQGTGDVFDKIEAKLKEKNT